ncbi:hypothetical protein [Nonomuraea soli]|uniref:Uncharacterized protein n=1 Tax=Nonomuraea soli TaxID=1032476 RepID=A0A7W0CJ15_9ACTN|nr:hypothetical protein [Nonomuraea soli]MBA2892107.1 hypothetical protein [Nonomuraea soli]
MASSPNDHGWTPYVDHGTRLRVRAVHHHGDIDYELCMEGGQMLIRRLDNHRKPVVISESYRGLARQAEDAWASLIRSLS